MYVCPQAGALTTLQILHIQPSEHDRVGDSRLQNCRWHRFGTADQLFPALVSSINSIAHDAIADHGAFRIVLPGGSTPHRLYGGLAAIETGWDRWHIYLSDERCLPATHPDRNSSMLARTLLARTKPTATFHAIPAESGPEHGALEYCAVLRDVPEFDLVLLGLGKDGHTASLFPERDQGIEDSGPAALAIKDAPPPWRERVSLSAWRLGHAKHMFFLVCGGAKRAAVERWRRGEHIPAAAIAARESVEVWLDAEAYGD